MSDSIFNLPEFKRYASAWSSRIKELQRRESYWDGSIYAQAKNSLGWLYPRLVQEIRPLYLPLARAVNVDSGIIPGGWKLTSKAQQFDAPVQQVFKWSRWPTEGVLYCHYGSLYGVTGLRVSDLREAGKVVLAPINPATFLLIGTDFYNSTPRLALVVESRSTAGLSGIDAESFEYAEVIEPDRIRTFANGIPYAFANRPPEYSNALGFVPFVEVNHIHVGNSMGDCAFSKAIPLLDEVNRLATELAEIVHRHKDPQYAVSGVDAESDLSRSGENVWLLPDPQAKASILLAKIDIVGALAFIREIRDQVEKSMPELAFDEITSKLNVAVDTVKLQLLELTLLIQRTRPNYDAGLASGLRMCGQAAASIGSRVTSASDVAVLDTDDLAFDGEREILPLQQFATSAQVKAEGQ